MDMEQRGIPTSAKTQAARAVLACAILLLALGGGQLLRRFDQRPGPEPHVHEFLIFNTYARLTFWGAEDAAKAAAGEIAGELKTLEKVINTYDPESEISRLNETAHLEPVPCSERLWGIIDASRQAHELTAGAFDISVGPLMKLWGFYGKRQAMPSEQEIAEARDLVGLHRIAFDREARTVRFERAGMFLDFGGIAKGYALDIGKAIAARHGLTCGMIDLGGNIACLETPPPGKQAYTVGIRNPARTDQVLETAELRGMCIATSGNYERCFLLDGQFIHHIIDPQTGRPVPAMASVSVATPSGLASDIFSTAIFVRGRDMAERYLASEPAARVLMISASPQHPEEMTIERFNWPVPEPRK